MNYELICATKDDNQFIYDLKKRSIFEYVNEIWGWDEVYQIKDFNDSFILGNYQVIMLDGLKMGFVEIFENKKLINISEIHIEKEYRGNGIGSDIIKNLINKACQQNKLISLGCFKKNIRAKTLYERLGFNLMEETKTHFLYEYNPNNTTKHHYDSLIDENNDPCRDPLPLREYMDKWDGQVFIDNLQLTTEKTVLEIGVGTGRLAMRVCNNCKSLTGIDLSPKTIIRAKENLQAFKNITLICADFMDYPFNNNFDVIYSSLTFMHIKNKQAAINKVSALLTSNGRFVLSIDKNQSTVLNFVNRKIDLFPDTSEAIISYIKNANLLVERHYETEFAIIFVAYKK